MSNKPDPITTPKIIDEFAGETGIPKEQLLLIVARSALIRHLAGNDETKDRFVLKGGTLLYHVYGTQRMSVRDADLAHPGTDQMLPDDLEKVLTVDLRPSFHLPVAAGRWDSEGGAREMFEFSDIPFTINKLTDPRIDRPAPRGAGMKITISLRESEWIDPQPPKEYFDPLLAHNQRFLVNALTPDELAAEKIIGWALRAQVKHYVDLALLARDHAGALDSQVVQQIVREKFRIERKAESTSSHYRALNLRTVRDLATRFRSPETLGQLTQTAYAAGQRNTIVLLEPQPDLAEIGAVKTLVEGFWGEVIDALAN